MLRSSRPRLNLPHTFVLEALDPLHPEVQRMFSGFAVYSGDRLLMMLRDNVKSPQDNGIWLVLSEDTDPADESLRRDFPSIRRIELLGGKIGHWLLLPSDDDAFEQLALHACDLILGGCSVRSRHQIIAVVWTRIQIQCDGSSLSAAIIRR